MYPKRSRSDNRRSSKPHKRRFTGNQFTKGEEKPLGQSATAKKFSTVDKEGVDVDLEHGYRIIQFLSVFNALAEFLVCRACKKDIRFTETGQRGVGFKIVVSCSCGRREINSGPFVNNAYEINRRIIFVMRLLGISRQGLNLFCGMMDICQGIAQSTYDSCIKSIHSVSKEVFSFCTKKAVKEEQNENVKAGQCADKLTVSGDGSWKKRGFTSLYGVTTLVGNRTGKVVDLDVKGSYCQGCTFWNNKVNTPEYQEWYANHVDECSNTHKGSAGNMEVASMQSMFLRSVEMFNVKYSTYVGDGDTKTFKAISDINPYGDECIVTKRECVGHVEKRMGSRLRNLRKTEKLGGKGKLTEALIKKMTKYYGLAIRRNSDSVEKMEKAIMATYNHMCSTDQKPMHDDCPAGDSSWCKWRVAQATNELDSFTHPPPLHPDVKKKIIPIYKELTRRDLLERCLGGYTQNANESFNATVWRMAPKHLNCGLKVVEIAAYIAAVAFNEGYAGVMKIMEGLNCVIGQNAHIFSNNYDEARYKRQERRSLSCSKEARTARKKAQAELNDFYIEEEGTLYSPGIAD